MNISRLLMAALLSGSALAQAVAQEDRADFRDGLGYDPSPAYPFGRPNPGASAELLEFDFFVGAFDCFDRISIGNGQFRETQAIWNGAYFLNGYGIQDQYWANGLMTSNIRMYDARDGLWKVTFFSAPNYSTGTWVGGKEGDDMVLRRETELPDGRIRVGRLTFHDISDNGFEWKAETVMDGEVTATNWTSSCKRR